ncbi:Ldh family oxidoreductase [Fictibacillus enclensis]|uniref:Ldh family oxidoreductase n=1 Tax=Fictibacillus enclensis TaxID=1017270 RepID=UPI0024BFA338|nr:Ldh family oxidoreductase [Fictibacillus enclensis]WHY70541.1 Ldh family oxidoreductase [Fictibacillus enclensis]
MKLLINTKNKFIQYNELKNFVKDIFIAAGLDDWQSNTIAGHLVLANLRGVDSHGVSRVPIYITRLEKGLTNKNLDLFIERETSCSALIDANNSSGITAATKGIELAVQKAKQNGIGLVGIKNSNHCGMLADYSQYAASQDCIVLATTNAPANMAPWGGKDRFFGTNPFSYGIPAGEEPNIIFDMATSVVARGKIINAHRNNQQIPIGWAISKNGEPTTDAGEALEGLNLPVGGPKGYGIALMVDILSGLFTGASYGPHIGDLYNNFEKNQNVGQFFFVMRADLFQSIEEYKERIDQMIKEIQQVPLAPGVEKICLPGEIENNTKFERELNGVPLPEGIIEDLIKVANQYDVSSEFLKNLSLGGSLI